MQSQGYTQSREDHFLYTKTLSDGTLLILVLYVDDMLIAIWKSTHEIAHLKQKLHENFAMKDLIDASHILGMHITRDRSRHILTLPQVQYIQKVLQ